MRKQPLCLITFFFLLSSITIGQGYYEWSTELVSAKNGASGTIFPLDGSDFIYYSTTVSNSYHVPPQTQTGIRKFNNPSFTGNLQWPVNANFSHFQADFNNNLYLHRPGEYVLKYNSFLNLVDSFSIEGVLKEIDEHGFLYSYDDTLIRRYDESGIFIDEAHFPAANPFFRENGTYYTVDSVIIYYQYPNVIVSQIPNPVIQGYTRKVSRNFNYFGFLSTSLPNHFIVMDSTGQVIYDQYVTGSLIGSWRIDDQGTIIILTSKDVKLYSYGNHLKTLSLSLPEVRHVQTIQPGLGFVVIGRNLSLYYSGSYFFANFNIDHVDRVEIFIPPSHMRINPGDYGDLNAYKIIAGKMNTGTLPDTVESISVTTSLLNLCANTPYNINISTTVYSQNPQTNFYVELSDSTGDFTNPIIIGTGHYSVLKYTIPDSLSETSGYLLRVRQTNPPGYSPATNIISVKKTPKVTFEYYTGTYVRSIYDPFRLSFNGCSTVDGKIITTSPDVIYSWKKISHFNVPSTLSSGNPEIFNINLAYNERISGEAKDTVSGCIVKSEPAYVRNHSFNPIQINEIPDTLIVCIDQGPIVSPWIYDSDNKVYEGPPYTKLSNVNYYFPDSIGPGWHKVKISYALNCNSNCGPCADSVMIYIDTCSSFISTGNVGNGNIFCSEDTLWVPFTTNAIFDSTNVFNVQMINASGNIDIVGSGTASPIPVVYTQIQNVNYNTRFRVSSTSPYILGTPNSDGPLTSFTSGNFKLKANGNYILCSNTGSTISADIGFNTGNIKCFRDGQVFLDTTLLWSSNFSFVADQEGQYFIEYKHEHSGCIRKSSPITITDSTNIPSVTLSLSFGNDTICLPDSSTIFANSSLPSTYEWQRNNKLIPSVADSLLTVNRGGVYICSATTLLGCTVKSDYLSILERPYSNAKPDSLHGCASSGVYINSLTSNVHQIQWYHNDTIMPGATFYSFTTNIPGKYNIEIIDTNGCSLYSEPWNVFIYDPPVLNIEGSDTITSCFGDWVQLKLNSTPVHKINWFHNGAPYYNNGMSTQYVHKSGYYHANATLLNISCIGNSDSVYVNYVADPNLEITATPLSAICDFDTLMLQVPFDSQVVYEWFHNNIPIPNSDSSLIFVSVPGIYKVHLSHSLGCDAFSKELEVIQTSLPISQITAQGSTTFCLGDSVILSAPGVAGYTYQWMRNQLMIPLASNQNLTAISAGSYTVAVTDSNGCQSVSNPIQVNVPCIPVENPVEKLVDATEELNNIQIFPNPVKENIFIKVNVDLKDKLVIQVLDISGRITTNFSLNVDAGESEFEMNLRGLSPGNYSLNIIGEHLVSNHRITKL